MGRELAGRAGLEPQPDGLAIAELAEARRGDCSAVTADVRRPGAPTLTDAEIRERMSGNLCRCGAYANIVRAVRTVAQGEGVA